MADHQSSSRKNKNIPWGIQISFLSINTYAAHFYTTNTAQMLYENTLSTQEYTIRTPIHNGKCRAGHVK